MTYPDDDDHETHEEYLDRQEEHERESGLVKGMKAEHCLMDLQEFIKGQRERQARNVEAIKAAKTLTREQEIRFEVGWCMLRDLLHEMQQMADSWAISEGAYRVTEKAMKAKP